MNIVPKRRVHPSPETEYPAGDPETVFRAEEAPAPPRQVLNIDELTASPWIGHHYRHEFLLHHRHELLEQHLKD